MTRDLLRVPEEDVLAHERRVDELREAMRLAEEEIAVHEVLLDLARNDRLIAAVGELYDDPSGSRFGRDPSKYCAEEGISLPEGVEINAVDTTDSSPRMIAVVRRGASEVQAMWDRETGFSTRGLPNRVAIFAEEAILDPGKSRQFPRKAAGKQKKLCVRSSGTDSGGELRVLITAGLAEDDEWLYTLPNGD